MQCLSEYQPCRHEERYRRGLEREPVCKVCIETEERSRRIMLDVEVRIARRLLEANGYVVYLKGFHDE